MRWLIVVNMGSMGAVYSFKENEMLPLYRIFRLHQLWEYASGHGFWNKVVTNYLSQLLGFFSLQLHSWWTVILANLLVSGHRTSFSFVIGPDLKMPVVLEIVSTVSYILCYWETQQAMSCTWWCCSLLKSLHYNNEWLRVGRKIQIALNLLLLLDASAGEHLIRHERLPKSIIPEHSRDMQSYQHFLVMHGLHSVGCAQETTKGKSGGILIR